MDLHHTLSGYEPAGLTANGEIFAVGIFVDSIILPISAIITEKKLRTHQCPQLFCFTSLSFIKLINESGLVTFIIGPKDKTRISSSVSSSLS